MELRIEKEKALKLLEERLSELSMFGFNHSVWLPHTINVVREIFPIADPRVNQISGVKFFSQFQKNYEAVGKKQAEGLLNSFISDIKNFGKDPSTNNELDIYWRKKYEALNAQYDEHKIVSNGLANKAQSMMDAFDDKIAEVDRLNGEVLSRDGKIVALEAEVNNLNLNVIRWDNLTMGDFKKLPFKIFWGIIVFSIGVLISVFLFGMWVEDKTTKSSEKQLEAERDGYKAKADSLQKALSEVSYDSLIKPSLGSALPKYNSRK